MGLNLVAQIVILYTPVGQFLSDSLQYFRFEVNSNVLFPVMLNIHKNMAWCFCTMDITLIIWLDEIKDALCISASSWVTRQQCTRNTVRLPYCTLHWFGEVTQILRTSFSPQLVNHWIYPCNRYCRKIAGSYWLSWHFTGLQCKLVTPTTLHYWWRCQDCR